jgi:type IV pilus assembly protein PilO
MKLNQVQQLLVGLVLILVAAIVGEMFLFKQKKQDIRSTQVQIDTLVGQIQDAERIRKHAAELEEEMNHLQAQLERLKKILPPDIHKPKFIQDLRRYANEHGLEVVRSSTNKPVTSDVVVEHPFTMHVQGGYHDLGNFFAKISNYPRIVNIKGLFVTVIKKDAKPSGSTHPIQAEFVVSVFTYNEPTEAELKQQIEARKLEKQGGNKTAQGGK